VAAVEQLTLPPGVDFVGSHPLAGSEKRGAEFARGDLFDQRLCVITPTNKTSPAALERTLEFWRGLGMRVTTMDPDTHDQALATTSHLPHALASALASILPAEWRCLTAGGFRDTTRIAAGDAEMWTAIFRDNKPAVLAALDAFDQSLARFRAALDQTNANELMDWLNRAKENRDALGT